MAMGSGEREKTTTTTRHPHLSSLVVRATESSGGSDYEPGEVRRDPPPYSRSDHPGYGMRAGSGSPLRHRKVDHHYSSDFDHSRGPPRGRGFRGGSGPGRFQNSSPYGRGRGDSRFSGRGFDGPGLFRGECMNRNNPNVPPREGDWICSDHLCGNLNFARREYCNKCNKFRSGLGESPRRNYLGPSSPHSPPPRFSGRPMNHSPGRGMNDFRSPPRGWDRDGPREFGGGRSHPRHGGRFPDHHMRRERPDYGEDEDYRERSKFDRPTPADWSLRDHRRDFYHRRSPNDWRNEQHPPSSPLPPRRGHWERDARERSRSPLRGGPPLKVYRQDRYMGRVSKW